MSHETATLALSEAVYTMDLRQLRYFIALLEHRSFVRAADAMGITQPAFSRSIQGLEQEFGCVLVDRGNKDLRPTAEGQVVLQHALRLVQGAATLSNEVAQMNKLDAGELRLGSCALAAEQLLPQAVAQFINEYPKVRTSFQIGDSENLGRSLQREDIEFFIDDIRTFEADPAYQTLALTPRHSVFFCRPQHPLCSKDSLSTNELFNYPLAGPELPAGMRKVLANLSGKTDLALSIESPHLSALIRVVQQSDAIGIATLQVLQEAFDRGELARLHWRNQPHNLESLSLRPGIVSRSGYRLSVAAQMMIERLQTLDQLG